MAKAATATATSKFFVALKGYKLQGLVEGSGKDEIRHETRPRCLHIRPQTYDGTRLGDEWFTEDEINDPENGVLARRGLKEIPDKWPRNNRPRFSGLVGKQFDGCVIEAREAAIAQAEFGPRFGVSNTNTSLYVVRQVKPGAPLGLANSDEV